jgi:hypothetical protein
MSPSTALRPRTDEAASWRGFVSSDFVAIVAAALAALLVTLVLVDTPPRVDLTIVNDTDYELTIAAARPGSNSWLPVMVIEPGQEQLKTGVIDPGPEWLLRFAGQGEDGGQVAITRDELEASGWRYVVPSDVTQHLESAGATPPPR